MAPRSKKEKRREVLTKTKKECVMLIFSEAYMFRNLMKFVPAFVLSSKK